MKMHKVERILSGYFVASLVYSRALSLTPGTDLALSTTERLYAPSNVRLEEFPIASVDGPVFMVFVDQSVPWMVISALAGIAWIALWSFLPRYKAASRRSSFLEDELGSEDRTSDEAKQKDA